MNDYQEYINKKKEQEDKMTNSKTSFWLGLLGSIALIVGVFAPLIGAPFGVLRNYMSINHFLEIGDGIIILTMAGISLIAISYRKYEVLYFTSLISAGMLTFTYLTMGQILQRRGGFGELAAELIQYQWGWAVLIIGIFLHLVAAMKYTY